MAESAESHCGVSARAQKAPPRPGRPALSTRAAKHAAAVVAGLRRQYPHAKCSLDFRTPLELLVATILSAQCTDLRVNLVTKDLFRKYPTAAHYAGASLAELERDVQPTGFFRNKAKNIQNACRILAERHGGQVPPDLDELVALPGVGRKTANVVLGTAFHVASGVVVDTHVARISRRLGLTRQKDPEKIETDLQQQLPRKEWVAFSHRMIRHGRECCTARSPKCGVCPLGSICPRIGVSEKQ
ncbi:MAG: endonuclease III [Thermoguttaceae bacterium]|jgi:endonuclease-3